MGEVGRWDERLFRAFRRSRPGSEARRRLFNELVRINKPLIRLLVGQLRGEDSAAHKGRGVRLGGRRRARVIGAEELEWEIALEAGLVAWSKAMETFDPSRSSIASYLKRKIFHELQCCVTKAGVVTTERDAPRPPTQYVEDDASFERILEPEHLSDLELFESLPIHLPPPDTRTALEVLFADHCAWGRARRCPASALHGRYALLAAQRGELGDARDLRRALRDRDVRATSVRVSWSPAPVWAFAGVALQPSPRPPSLQSRRM